MLVSACQEADLRGKLALRPAFKLLGVETVLVDRFHLNVRRFTVRQAALRVAVLLDLRLHDLQHNFFSSKVRNIFRI